MSGRKQDRPLSARLAEFGDAVAAATRRVREAELEHGRVTASVEAATFRTCDLSRAKRHSATARPYAISRGARRAWPSGL